MTKRMPFPTPTLCVFGIIANIFLRISEYDKYNPNLRTLYMITHSIWHIMIYAFLNEMVKTIKI